LAGCGICNSDLAMLATLLGPASSATTRYLHPDAARVQEMVADL